MKNVILKITNLTKKYKDKLALDNISFEIEKGKIYGFIGENGAGKTTTIRAITGLTVIDEGIIELFGKSDKKGLEQARKKMGCLVERPILSLDDTAFNNLNLMFNEFAIIVAIVVFPVPGFPYKIIEHIVLLLNILEINFQYRNKNIKK